MCVNEQYEENGDVRAGASGDGGAERDAGAEGLGETDDEAEGRPMHGAKAPREPSREEREEHDLTHWPRRPWCKHCVSTGCVASPHYGGQPKDRSKPIISLDYCYPGAKQSDLEALWKRARERYDAGEEAVNDEVPQGSHPAIVLHDSATSSIYAFAVSRKGACSSRTKNLPYWT